jgi:Icc-related predicted phosphoesterase
LVRTGLLSVPAANPVRRPGAPPATNPVRQQSATKLRNETHHPRPDPRPYRASALPVGLRGVFSPAIPAVPWPWPRPSPPGPRTCTSQLAMTARRRELRIAALGDVHCSGAEAGALRPVFIDAAREADVLVICGDLTTHGQPDQMRGLIDELQGVEIPVVAVLGNHDYESDAQDEIKRLLVARGVHVLDGDGVVIEGVGFAGVKGMGGGFDRGALSAFGERIYKDFVQAAIDEALKLERALQKLQTETTIAVLHYSPIRDTLAGEPEEILPFLGSSRLLPPIDTYRPTAVFHGHAHIGKLEAKTPAGVPVFNVAHTLLLNMTGRGYRVWTTAAPERRAPRSAPAERTA